MAIVNDLRLPWAEFIELWWGRRVRLEILLVDETPKCQEEDQSKEAANCYAYYCAMTE